MDKIYWEKKGRILSETDLSRWSWAKSHFSVPTIFENEDSLRLYFSPRNEKGQSIPVYVDIDKNDLSVVDFGESVIELGEIGTFDDGGIMPCSIVKVDNKIYMYYVGWNPSVSVPYRNSIGLSISSDGGKTFQRIHKGPVVDRNIYEPFFTASPFVLKHNEKFMMWYSSSTGFYNFDNTLEPMYHIKYAESLDGINWDRPNISCILPNYYGECTARPSVFIENNKFKMYYTYRGSENYRDGKNSYQIGYAESEDGKVWIRMDNKILFSNYDSDWDSKMMTYPNFIKIKNKKYLFYNGNSFGKTGIGYAEYF
jgi:hypothetical protein